VRVNVRLFAVLRERAGSESLEIDLDEGATVADAIRALAPVAGEMPFRLAVNREYASDTTPITQGDELAAIPPVSGGASETTRVVRARVSAEPLDLEALSRSVGDPAAGAIVTFQGVTREVDSLSYEAYAEMAEPRIEAILRDCAERHGLQAIAAEHRIGEVPLGEASVIVAVSAGHRGEAFAGAREAIDRIKAEAPIWKKEISDGGESWVEGALP
jgi:molybdopterin synthase catalytic subunit/molybdopterin converting factor small subunit